MTSADHLPALARAAADRRRPRRSPLTRREAIAEASALYPDDAPPGHRRAFCAVYADRLLDRGLAEPSTEGSSGPSGPSGRHVSPRRLLVASEEQWARWGRAAKGEGVNLSEWLRRAADARAGNL